MSLQLSFFSPTLRDPDCLCPCPHIQGPLIEQPARCPPPTPPTPTPSALSDQKTHIHAHCPSCILKHVHYQQQQTVAGWLAADKAQTQPAWPCRHRNSGGDKLWPPATSSQLYICHMLMTSSLWPPTDRAVLEGSRLRNKVVSPWNASLILSLWHSVPGLEGFNPFLNGRSAVKSLATFSCHKPCSLNWWVWNKNVFAPHKYIIIIFRIHVFLPVK